MDEFLPSLADGIRELSHALIASPEVAAGGAWLSSEALDGVEEQAVALGLAVFLAVLVLARLLGRGRRRRHEITQLREKLRESELKIQALSGEVAAAHMPPPRFDEQDPEVFARALAAAVAEEGSSARNIAPEIWLDPLRPALSDAYLRLARGVLGEAKGEADLARARTLALGAFAASPEREDCGELLSRIEEAQRLGLFSDLSEADVLVWRILCLDSGAEAGAARGLTERRSGRIGYNLHLSGWEPEELRDAAQAEFADHAEATEEAEDSELSDAVGSGETVTFRSRRRRTRAAGSRSGTKQAGRVYDMAAGKGGDRPASANADKTARRRQGGTSAVLVLPVGAARDAQDARGDDDSVGISKREAELLRLWQRRRRPDMLGEEHPRTLAARANVAHEIGRRGRNAEAEEMFREVLEVMCRPEVLGERHADTLTVRHNLAVEIARQGRLDDAEREFEALLGGLGMPGGPGRGHPLALAAAHGLAEIWAARGDHAEAEAGFGAVWKARADDAAFGPDHPHTLWSRVRMLRVAEARADPSH